MADISYKDLIAPSFYGLWNDVVQKKYPEIWLAGGRGCVDKDTLIETPRGQIPIGDFNGGSVYSYDVINRRVIIASAEPAKQYTIEDLYEVKMYGGQSIVVTDEHLFLTPNGWRMTKELERDSVVIVGERIGGISIYAKIEYIKFKKRDYYWDVNVIGTHNYIAHGFVNHNSTKSSFVSTCIPLLMEMNPKLHCCCFRKYGTNLADSVYAQFEYTINEKLRPIADHWLFKKSPLKIINTRTNQQILFRGLDDPQKVKSLKAPFGYFGLIWLEELAEFDGIEEVRNVLQSLRRGGHYFQTFCSYNPPETSANWVNYEANVPQIVDGKLYRYVHHSDYRTVPRHWLGDDFFISANLLKETNERAYRHEYLGEVTGNGGAVFPNVEAIEINDAMIAQFSNRRFGLDWGFAIDPACWIALEYDKTRRAIYIYDEIYDKEMTNPYFASLIEKKDMGFSYLMCDAAEPKSIAEFESLGINALPAQKGPDSVRFSIKWLQGLCHIFIDPIRCPNAFREFSQYEYEKNKSGQFVSRYPDKNNHAIDACLDGKTLVMTTKGKIPIENLVGKSGVCKGYDTTERMIKTVGFKNVRLTREHAEVLKVSFEYGGNVICTPDHRILVKRGFNQYEYVQAEKLKPNDFVMDLIGGVRVLSIKGLAEHRDVYDLEVPQTHNFAVNEGVFVHNCRYALMEDAIEAGLF